MQQERHGRTLGPAAQGSRGKPGGEIVSGGANPRPAAATLSPPLPRPAPPHAAGACACAALFFFLAHDLGLVWKRQPGRLADLSWVRGQPDELTRASSVADLELRFSQVGLGAAAPACLPLLLFSEGEEMLQQRARGAGGCPGGGTLPHGTSILWLQAPHGCNLSLPLRASSTAATAWTTLTAMASQGRRCQLAWRQPRRRRRPPAGPTPCSTSRSALTRRAWGPWGALLQAVPLPAAATLGIRTCVLLAWLHFPLASLPTDATRPPPHSLQADGQILADGEGGAATGTSGSGQTSSDQEVPAGPQQQQQQQPAQQHFR